MTIPFLIDFVPYKFVGQKCASIDDMVSVSVLQRVPVSNIAYDIGSTQNIELPISVKNITNNASLQVTFSMDANVFVINNETGASEKNILLAPGQSETVVVTLNTDRLDQTIRTLQSQITLTVRNISTGGLVTRNTPPATLAVSFLDETISTIS